MLWQPSQACNFFNTNNIEVKKKSRGGLDEFQQHFADQKRGLGLMFKNAKHAFKLSTSSKVTDATLTGCSHVAGWHLLYFTVRAKKDWST